MTRRPSPRGAALTLLAVLCPWLLAAGGARGQDEDAPRVRTVAILVFQGVELLDFAGPGEVFAAARGPDGPLFDVETVGLTGDPVTSQRFLTIRPSHALEDAPDADIVVIPGGAVPLRDAALLRWIRERGPDTLLFSVCNGALLLARAGLLEGLDATTHHSALEALMVDSPTTRVWEGRRFVDNGRIVTAAGVSAGIDGALHLVARLHGEGTARETACYMEYAWDPAAARAAGRPAAESAERSLAFRVLGLLREKSVDEALASWPRLRAESARQPDEMAFNALGYRLLRHGRVEAAVGLLRFNTRIFPESANVWDSLSEACEHAGRVEEALQFAQRALAQLDHDDTTEEGLRKSILENAARRVLAMKAKLAGKEMPYVCPPCPVDCHDRRYEGPGLCEVCHMVLIPVVGPERPRRDDAGAFDERLDALEAALEAGERDAAAVLVDPALMDLHGVRRFRRLMKRHASRSDLTIAPGKEPGRRLVVTGRVTDPEGRPLGGARIYAYHADAGGSYAPTGAMDEPRARLFGYLVADAEGRFTLRTVRPGGYREPIRLRDGSVSRIPEHVHLTVSAEGHRPRLLGILFADDPRLDDTWRREAAEDGDVIITLESEGGVQHGRFTVRLERR